MGGAPISADSIGAAQVLSNLVHGDLMMPGLGWSAPVTDAAMEKLSAVLLPLQFAALRQLQAQQAAHYLLAPPRPKGASTEDALALYRKSGRR